MFVINWTDKKVQCKMMGQKQIREFNRNPLFQGMKLFKGMNVWIEIVISPGQMVCSAFESKKHKLIQLYNYWVLNQF